MSESKSTNQRPTVSVEELSIAHAFTLTAIIELLQEKGILSQAEVLERISKIRARNIQGFTSSPIKS